MKERKNKKLEKELENIENKEARNSNKRLFIRTNLSPWKINNHKTRRLVTQLIEQDN